LRHVSLQAVLARNYQNSGARWNAPIAGRRERLDTRGASPQIPAPLAKRESAPLVQAQPPRSPDMAAIGQPSWGSK
jgi:hypothetical protein